MPKAGNGGKHELTEEYVRTDYPGLLRQLGADGW